MCDESDHNEEKHQATYRSNMELHFSEFTTKLSYRRPRHKKILKIMLYALVFLTGCSAAAIFYGWNSIQPPNNFPVGEKIEIAEGESVIEIVEHLREVGVIKSELALYAILTLLHDPTSIKASTYKFKEPQTAFEIAARLAEGEFGIDLIRFVHYEGERNEILAKRASELLDDFDVVEFMKITAGKEGRMFPDTYLIPETYTANELMTLLEATYESRIAPLRPSIASSNYTEDEVIIIASLIEREANTRESKRMVAGIIANRIAEGMALQLDASIEYVLETPLNILGNTALAEELATSDSPYNTYANLGLPPTPIGNPGLTSIEAVLRPTESNYLFYLTGNNGNFYYARTLAEHNRNIDLYLR